MMTTNRVEEAAHEVIDWLGLHDNGAPVDLTPLEDYFRIRLIDLSGTGSHGFLKYPKRGSIQPNNPAKVFLNKHNSAFDRRILFAHEVGHGVLGHEGTLRCESVDDWFTRRQEREAWRFAATLLIPRPHHLEDWNEGVIAAQCQVWPWLVSIWQSPW